MKGSFLCVKTIQPITTVVNKGNKSFQFSPHRISMVFRIRRDCVERKIVDQLKINKYIQLSEVLVDFVILPMILLIEPIRSMIEQ